MLHNLNFLRREIVKNIVDKEQLSIVKIRTLSKVSKIIASCTNDKQLIVTDKVLTLYQDRIIPTEDSINKLTLLKQAVERRVRL